MSIGAGVTIDFFALNQREELWEDRFRVIRMVFNAVGQVNEAKRKEVVAAAMRTVSDAVSESGPQASCARAYLKLLKSDPELAWKTYQAAEDFVRTERKKRAQKSQARAKVAAPGR
jgi:hypothetical protein